MTENFIHERLERPFGGCNKGGGESWIYAVNNLQNFDTLIPVNCRRKYILI
jgi:hypothetical protein